MTEENKDLEDSNEKVYDKVNVNKTQDYVCYSHPTKRNEKGHVKQVTRSIKDLKEKDSKGKLIYNEEKLDTLCSELDNLLKNFITYTHDFLSIEEARTNFNTKAFDWIISEELQNNPDKITKSTLESCIPISEKSTVFMNESTSFFAKNDIPDNIFNDNCRYVFVNEKDATEFSAVIELKGFDDLENFIINKLTFIINLNFSNHTDDEFNYYKYLGIVLEDKTIEDIKNCISEIKKSYLKTYSLRKQELYKCDKFNNHIYNRLRNENHKLVVSIYDILTQNIKLFDECISYKFDLDDNIPKIIHFKSDDKNVFFGKLENLFSFNKRDKSIKNLIKTVRLKGNFFKENNENNETSYIINNLKNMPECMSYKMLNINLDGVKTKDTGLANWLEKVIVYGRIKDCDFTFTKTPTDDEFFDLSDNLIDLFSRNKIINYCKYIYANEFILKKNFKVDDVVSISSSKITPPPGSVFVGLSKLVSNISGIYKFDESNDLVLVLDDIFKAKIKQYFDDIYYEYVSPRNIVISIKEILLESFMYSLYKILIDPDKLLRFSFGSMYCFILDYNKFIEINWNKIIKTIDEIEINLFSRIFDELSNINDYALYKKTVLNAILYDIKIPNSYIKKFCYAFESFENDIKEKMIMVN